MDPSPYEDNYLVHLYFHYVEKYFFSLPPNTLFPIPKHKGPLFFNFNPLAMEEGNPSNRHPLFLADGNAPVNPGAERRGMVMFGGMTPWGGIRQGEKEDGGER